MRMVTFTEKEYRYLLEMVVENLASEAHTESMPGVSAADILGRIYQTLQDAMINTANYAVDVVCPAGHFFTIYGDASDLEAQLSDPHTFECENENCDEFGYVDASNIYER